MNIKKYASSMVRQHGFNMIEMMISIAIGLVMILFVGSLYIGSKGSYQISDDNARLQQDGRIVMALIGRNLTQAGYGNPTGFESKGTGSSKLITNFMQLGGQAFRACDNGFSSPSTIATKTCAAAGAGATPAFEVSYVGDSTHNVNIGAGVDCNGQEVLADALGNRMVVNRFYLDTKAGEGQSLFCVGNGNPTGQPILGNVEALVLTYGVDTNGDQTPDGYYKTVADVKTAEALATPPIVAGSFGGVVSVGVCLQLSSANNVLTQAQDYRDCSGALKTAADRKLHVVLNAVYTIRNNSDTTLLTYK